MPVPAWKRAGGYGIQSTKTDGNDLIAVRHTAKQAVEYVRTEGKPFLLECHTTRLGKHKQGQGDIRSIEEMAELSLRDPLLRISVDPEARKSLAEQVEAAIQAALAGEDPAMPKGE
jgi:TPP-dependent pyruvate/acetoin dehydrogenase alpha subunit